MLVQQDVQGVHCEVLDCCAGAEGYLLCLKEGMAVEGPRTPGGLWPWAHTNPPPNHPLQKPTPRADLGGPELIL